LARECVRTIAGWRPRPRQARLPADKTWLTAARAAGLTPLAALIAVAHICPSHRARQTPLDGQGRRRSEWGFRRRRPARGSQRAASRPMYRRPPLKSSSIRRWHASPDHWPPFLPSRRRSFLAGFTSAPPESPSLRSGCDHRGSLGVEFVGQFPQTFLCLVTDNLLRQSECRVACLRNSVGVGS